MVDTDVWGCYNGPTFTLIEVVMSYKVFYRNTEFGPRDGLEGPFNYPNGRVLYYDAKQGDYWDPLTDFYVDRNEVAALQNQIFDTIRG